MQSLNCWIGGDPDGGLGAPDGIGPGGGGTVGAADGPGNGGPGAPDFGMGSVHGGFDSSDVTFGGRGVEGGFDAVGDELGGLDAILTNPTFSKVDFSDPDTALDNVISAMTSEVALDSATAISGLSPGLFGMFTRGRAGRNAGQSIGQSLLDGIITAEQGNQAIADANLGIIGTAAANFSAATGGIPPELKAGMTLVPGFSTATTIGIALASLASAITGQGMLGAGEPTDPGDGGPAFDSMVAKGRQYAKNLGWSDQDVLNVVSGTGDTSTDADSDVVVPVQEANDELEYNHTLAELSGIELTPQETQYLDAQRDIAIDRAITEIEDTFAMEGESMVARQIHNLGTNALGGTIGQTFVKRWQERKAGAKTAAMQDIESSYLSAKEQRRLQKQQQQVGIWDKQFEADVQQAGIDLDKWKVEEGLDWEREKLTTVEEQAALDRALQERMGSTEVGAWKDANKWGAVGGILGSVAGSDWFGSKLTSWGF